MNPMQLPERPPLCSDCKHFRENPDYAGGNYAKDVATCGLTAIVHPHDGVRCLVRRQSRFFGNEACGPTGKQWEAK